MSISRFLSLGPLTSVERTTDRAGRFSPAASVSVQTQNGSSFSWNSSSTTRRYRGSSPAWWTPTPRASSGRSLFPLPTEKSKSSSRSSNALRCPSANRSSPLSTSAVLQQTSRSKQNTSAGVRRRSSVPAAIPSRKAGSRSSPTQWKCSGTRRSRPSTSVTRRSRLRAIQPTNSWAAPTVADSSMTRTWAGSSDSASSQTIPRWGSLKLWNSSITTAATLVKSNASWCSSRLSSTSATTTLTGACGLTVRLPVTSPTWPRSYPHRSTVSWSSTSFWSVRAMSGVE